MQKIWLITDTHFGHKNIARYCGRPPGWEKLILNHWRDEVARQDLVYHLGDVAFWNKTKLKWWMSRLPGTKILVRGNHDGRSNRWYMEAGFAAVVRAVEIAFQDISGTNVRALLSHQPRRILPEGVLCNIHGHVHNGAATPPEPHYTSETRWGLYALEYTDYYPIELRACLGTLDWYKTPLLRTGSQGDTDVGNT